VRNIENWITSVKDMNLRIDARSATLETDIQQVFEELQKALEARKAILLASVESIKTYKKQVRFTILLYNWFSIGLRSASHRAGDQPQKASNYLYIQ
jgi:hypothetical protein